MANIPLEVQEPRPQPRPSGFVLLESGHRPFFLAAALYGTLAMPLWLVAWSGGADLSPWWHGHEMIFGFTAAAIGGFLMAAVPTWTSRPRLTGLPLAALVGLWIAGRLAVPFEGWAWIDLLFLPALAGWALVQVVAARNVRNYQVPAIVLALAACNGVAFFHDPLLGLELAVLLIMALIALIGGRIVPSFTQNALRMQGDPTATCSTPPVLDRLAVPVVVVAAAVHLVVPGSVESGVAALVAGALLLARMANWQTLRTLRQPFLWILHVGYAWVPLGFLLKGISDLGGPLEPSAALHAFTTGAIGVMILAVGSRAALGHSGRPLKASPATVAAYILVIAAALVRVFGPDDPGVMVSGVLWTLGYGLFAVVYWPILTRPRVDGRPG